MDVADENVIGSDLPSAVVLVNVSCRQNYRLSLSNNINGWILCSTLCPWIPLYMIYYVVELINIVSLPVWLLLCTEIFNIISIVIRMFFDALFV